MAKSKKVVESSEDDDEEVYEVEAVKDYRKLRGKSEYLVSWVGWPGTDTWIPEEDAGGAPELTQAYWDSRPAADFAAAFPSKAKSLQAASRKAPPSSIASSVSLVAGNDAPPSKTKRGRKSNADTASASVAQPLSRPSASEKRKAGRPKKSQSIVVDSDEEEDTGGDEADEEQVPQHKAKSLREPPLSKGKGKAHDAATISETPTSVEETINETSLPQSSVITPAVLTAVDSPPAATRPGAAPSPGRSPGQGISPPETEDVHMGVAESSTDINAYEFEINHLDINAEDKMVEGRYYLALERKYASQEHDWEELVTCIDGMQHDENGTLACLFWSGPPFKLPSAC
ncbi:hypothetical protein P7C70_g1048, partial [Phenoliferia sp. Uapishka_3]